MSLSIRNVVTLALFVAGSLVFMSWIPDDAYISFRYARNFADGHGLVFNLGERVEGYSNFLWTLILGVLGKMGVDIVSAARILSTLFAYSTVVLALRVFEFIAGDVAGSHTYRSHLWAVSLTLVVSLPMVYWGTSGLETPAAAFFLLLGMFLHLRAEREGRPEAHLGSVIAYLMVAVLRPEGIIYSVVNGVILYVRMRGRMPWSVKLSLILTVVVFAAFLASRSFYYQSIVPNTYWAKPSTTVGFTHPLVRGLKYLARYFIVSGLVLMLPMAVLAFLGKGVRYTVYYLGALLVVQLAFITWVGGDVLRFDRFSVAFHAVLLALVLAGLVRWEASRGKRRLLRIAVWGAVIAAVGLNGARIQRANSKYCIHDFMHAHFHARLGEALDEMLPRDATLVFNEIGAVPYYTGRITLDMIGLTDKTVASIVFESYQRWGTTETEFCRRGISDYLLQQDPECVILPSWGPIDTDVYNSPAENFHPIWYGIYQHPVLRSEYRADFSIEHSPRKFLHVFLRRDISVDHAALEWVREPECVTVTIHE
jgi:hypothetical protein